MGEPRVLTEWSHEDTATVVAWRLHILIDAQYPVPLAEQLAERFDIDLHQAVELVAHGCTPALALEILL